MLAKILKKVFGSRTDRELKRLQPLVSAVADFEPRMKALPDAQLQAKTAEFRQRLENGAPLDDLLPEAFATVREAATRTLGQRHYDVQIIGGVVLHRGNIAEMKTGEGKTLVATLPVYLNALLQRGVHVVTVNDYLAKRDAEWMGKVYRFLGLSVGVIVHDLDNRQRKRSYNSDVTYGTNSEFGFDYLRDNMKYSLQEYVQRDLFYGIVDEVDSILIDEARTPLIISGRPEDSSDLYMKINALVPTLRSEIDYTVDEKAHSAALTDEGVEKVEQKLAQLGLLKTNNLFDSANIEILHHMNQALRANTLYKRDVNYVVKEGKVIIVDEHTGRLMPGRRWSDGLHQAVEAKEQVPIEAENRTVATITYQNYFRMYKKLSGMTGTAETEAEEFDKIYDLDVIVIPTNRTLVRQDAEDLIYKTEEEKFTAVIDELVERNQAGQPVLVGTVSVEKSERVSRVLKKKGIRHEVLNAKNHEREAEIVAQAGKLAQVTISTNMAGRGTDIVLGGNPEFLARQECLTNGWVIPEPEAQPGGAHPFRGTAPSEYKDQHGLSLKPGDPLPDKFTEAMARHKETCDAERQSVLAAGGLAIIGTERHESRRIDNQLRGRSGRQGDPGCSRFYVSLEDDLMRIFGAERVKKIMEWTGMQKGEPIEHRWVTAAIENAQKKVEGHHFDSRKNLLEYDDVMNLQRKTIYGLRRTVLQGFYPPEGEGQELDPERERKLKKTLKYGLLPAPPPEPTLETEEQVERWKAEQERERSDMLKNFRTIMIDLTEDVVQDLLDSMLPEGGQAEDADPKAIEQTVKEIFNVLVALEGVDLQREALRDLIFEKADGFYKRRELETGPDRWNGVARWLYLQEIDTQWMEHLGAMDHLREGIGLRGYGQRDPKQEYKKEGYAMFVEMLGRIRENTVKKLFHVQFKDEVQADEFKPKQRTALVTNQAGAAKPATAKREAPKIGRNDP
ncbi:MAG TPA: preprotein translocase subunit SecA, partial [Myxococcota bacterium]|nr:preprotein translocase subunit SecA [Myxococcota bacterium]